MRKKYPHKPQKWFFTEVGLVSHMREEFSLMYV